MSQPSLVACDADPLFAGARAMRAGFDHAALYLRLMGDGPPLLLLHGFPQTGAMWARAAPRLAERFQLVIPDLQGYGRSSGPVGPEAYAKRAQARDLIAAMAALGHDRFGLAGHDRGGRVGYRAALDHPDRIQRLAVLDILPTLDYWTRFESRAFALAIYHWPLLAQPYPLPETLIGGAPDFFVDACLRGWAKGDDLSHYAPAALEEYRANARDPATLRAMCDDYRAGAGVDVEHDAADRDAGRRIQCPLLTLNGGGGIAAAAGGPLEVWRRWCADEPEAASLECGHFLAEERPEDTAARLTEFFVKR